MNLVTVKEFLEVKLNSNKFSIEDKALYNSIEFCESLGYIEDAYYVISHSGITSVYHKDKSLNYMYSHTIEYLQSLLDHIEKWKASEDIVNTNLSEAYEVVIGALKDNNYSLEI